MKKVLTNLYPALKPDSYCIFVVGEVKKGTKSIDTSLIIKDIVLNNSDFKLLNITEDVIPYSRRIRSGGDATKKEWGVIMKKEE